MGWLISQELEVSAGLLHELQEPRRLRHHLLPPRVSVSGNQK